MQAGADDAGRVLERGELRGVDRAALAGVVEAHDADELARHEDGHDGLGLGADAFEAGDARDTSVTGAAALRLAGIEAHAASGPQLRGDRGELALVAGADRRIIRVRRHARRRPLAHADQQRLAFGAAPRHHDVDPVHMGRIADQAQHLGDGAAHVGGLEQHPARLGRGDQQGFPPPQRLVDLAQLLGAGTGA